MNNDILQKNGQEKYIVPVSVSARHAHLSEKDLETLFGSDHCLSKAKDLVQPGQYACEERVTLIGPKGRMENIRVIGPIRKETQVEISITDSFKVGIPSHIRMSGELDGTPGCRLVGPKGEVTLDKGVIVSARHMHLTDEQAASFGLKNLDIVTIHKGGVRAVSFGNVIVRSGKGHQLEVHIDTDEANAAGLANDGEKWYMTK